MRSALGVATSATAILEILALAGCAPILGPLAFGRLCFALAIALVFGRLVDAGLNHLLSRHAREDADGALFLHSLIWKIVAAPLVGWALIVVARKIDPSPQTDAAVRVLLVGQFGKCAADTVRAGWDARGRKGLRFFSEIVERGALIPVAIGTAAAGGGLHGVALSIAIVRIASALLMVGVGPSLLKPGAFDAGVMWAMLGSAGVTGSCAALVALNEHGGLLLTSLFRGQTEAGLFAGAALLAAALAGLSSALSAAIAPSLAAAGRLDPGAFRRMSGTAFKFACAAGAAAAANGILAAPSVVEFVFGGGYARSAGLASILFLGLPMAFGSSILRAGLLAGRRRWGVLSAAAGAITANFALGIGLVPRWGAAGAAIAVVGGEITGFGMLFFLMNEDLRNVAVDVFIKAPLAAVSAALAAFWLAPHGAAIQLVAANGVFSAVLLFSGFFVDRERKIMARGLTEAIRRTASPAAV